MKRKLSIDFSYIDEGVSYQIAVLQNEAIVKINKSAFDSIPKKFTKKSKGKSFLACPQNDRGVKNFLPVLFVYKRIITKNSISFVS